MDEQRMLKDCNKLRYEVCHNDLPLSCPISDMAWDLHPKVYLDVKEMGEVLCPYCGTLYVLVDNKS